VLPGPEAQQLATYIGWLMHRTWGGLIAGGLFVLPSLVLICLLAWIYLAFGDLPVVQGLLYGIKPAVTVIVLFAAYRIGSRAFKHPLFIAIAACAFLAIFLGTPFPLIILVAAIVGYVAARYQPDIFKSGGGHGAKGKAIGPAIIDDHTPPPAHAKHSWGWLGGIALVFIGLWAMVLALLATRYGWSGALAQMGWFFTKAALLTFGGAYAVLPYVYQGAVEKFQWLTAAQMIDGLALGETTPGPLIMIVAYVGFVGAWTKQVFGPDALLLAGIAGASVATFFTFLPSFLFILAGGPLVESTRGNLKLAAPLAGITAAVVGVILNLAIFFAYHTLWPSGFQGRFEWPALVIGIAAAIAVWRFKVGMIPVILGCALAGLAWRSFGI
jgi:chromate transporter